MSDLSSISIGGWECDITCDECYESLHSGNLADLLEEAKRHLAEHGPKVEERKRRLEEGRRASIKARAEWAKQLGREPSDWEWRVESDRRLSEAIWDKILADLPRQWGGSQ